MWTMLSTFLLAVVVPLAKRVAIALGFGLVTYAGFSVLLDWLIAYIAGQLAGMPAAMAAIAGRLGIHTAASMIVSAGVIKLTLRGLSGGSFTQSVWRAPGNNNLGA